MKPNVGWLVLLLLIAISIPCNADEINSGDLKEEGNLMDIIELVKILKSDVPNDHKSLVWDGQNLTEIEDELDDAEIIDGRNGEYRYNRLRTSVGVVYSVDQEDLLSTDNQVQNDEACFSAQSANRFIRVVSDAGDYSQLLADHATCLSGGFILECSFDWLQRGICEETILKAPDDRMMVGWRFIVPMADGTAKIYEYGGIGNCSDIMVEAIMMAQRTIR